MAKAYKTVLIFSLKNGEEAAKELGEKFKAQITESGSVENVEEWGKRRLAYPINYENEGYYMIIEHTSEPEFIAQLTRSLNITDGVLRYLSVAK